MIPEVQSLQQVTSAEAENRTRTPLRAGGFKAPAHTNQDKRLDDSLGNHSLCITEPGPSNPVGSATNPATSDEARLEAFLVKKWCYRVYRKALRSGQLVPGDCFALGPDCRGKKGNGHHHDYRRPLDVCWSCRGHHDALDRLRRSGHTLASAMVAVLLSSPPAARPPHPLKEQQQRGRQ